MKKISQFFTILWLLTFVFPLWGNKKQYQVTIHTIPENISDFEKMRDKVAITPEGGVAMLLVALKMYELNKIEGIKAIIVATDMPLLSKGKGEKSYKGYVLSGSYTSMLNSVYNRFSYIANSYFPQTSPENNYQMGLGPFHLEFSLHQHKVQNDKEHAFFVPCSGADFPRPVQVKKNNRGIWKAANYSSILVGIRPAKQASKEPDDDL